MSGCRGEADGVDDSTAPGVQSALSHGKTMNQIARHTARLLGVESVELTHFSSGDLSALMRAVTDEGQSYIVKTGPTPALEAEMT